ncbi:hypothetical protein BDA99DRAFT_536372 [Phascolomyces articulosus]|uniref:Uncharacterized protein n=1 Tax=Phascolomyces articulosus TaxID=60185 RepID=A0AAD5K1G2_9FUNG|nr:hypothetical protein BDA99DRAFT_536372 [Phascolomyces articulosus]
MISKFIKKNTMFLIISYANKHVFVPYLSKNQPMQFYKTGIFRLKEVSIYNRHLNEKKRIGGIILINEENGIIFMVFGSLSFMDSHYFGGWEGGIEEMMPRHYSYPRNTCTNGLDFVLLLIVYVIMVVTAGYLVVIEEFNTESFI